MSFISEDEGDVSLLLQEKGVPSVLDEIHQGDVVVFKRVGPLAVNLRFYSAEGHRGYTSSKFRIGRGAELETINLSLLT
ncbi:hypothetical protein [Geoalkalibacter subterraneus]|uniref:Uncharacterized protein n=1 Tax=Geoalkalibacter subterraneus TaxID=483547 RepID=A0A0B5FRB9_9BACT|nr:hypothetical protein [Geoalkalibacter subterraneus]AJF06670.1 hypothetical protein GSUB_09130 [Geoalkalibacter subterraneus]